MRYLSVVLLMMSNWVVAAPMTNQQASDAAATLGKTQDALTTPLITQSNVTAKIPQASATPAETQFFGGGLADNFTPGDSKRIACDTGAPNPDPMQQQSCNAVNLIAKAPGKRPSVSIGRQDPMLQREQAVRGMAPSIAYGGTPPANNPNGFGIAGAYSNCTTTTTPDPAPPQIKTCTDFVSPKDITSTSQCQQSVSTPQECHQLLSFTGVQPAPTPVIATTVAVPPSGCTVLQILSSWSVGISCGTTTVTVRDYVGSATLNGDCSGAPSTIPTGKHTCFGMGIKPYKGVGSACYATQDIATTGGQCTTVTIASWISGGNTTIYTCPAGTNPLPNPADSTSQCYPPAYAVESYTDNCTTLQALTQ